MAFPPNYNQDRNNRARNKARKALDKQVKREEKAAERKKEQPPPAAESAPPAGRKDER